MKTTRTPGQALLASVCLLALFLAAPSFAGERERLKREAAIREFLIRLGFEDYSGQARATLQQARDRHRRAGEGAVSPEVLKFNAELYEVFNHARELTASIFSELEENPELEDKFVELTAKMVALQPEDGPPELPAEVQNEPDKTRPEKIQKWLEQVIYDNIKRQARAVSADIVNTVLGEVAVKSLYEELEERRANDEEPLVRHKKMLEKIRRIEQHVGELVRFMYLSSEMGQTRYLGRAMAAAMMRYAMRIKTEEGDAKHAEKLMIALDRAVLKRDLLLSNFVGNDAIGSNVTLFDHAGKAHRLDIEQGDLIGERTLESEAAGITVATQESPENRPLAKDLGLTGHWAAVMINEGEVPEAGLGLWARLRNWLARRKYMSEGISHIGMADVLRDPQTGIRMVWAVDNYPNRKEGGIRIIGIPEQFALPGPMMRFVRARVNPYLYWDMIHKQIEERKALQEEANRTARARGEKEPYKWADGYPEIIGFAEKEVRAAGETKEEKAPEMIARKPFISHDDWREFHDPRNWPRERAPEYVRELFRRQMEVFRRIYLSESGLAFANNFSFYIGRGYCSFTCNLSSLQANGVDMQEYPSEWSPLFRLIHHFNPDVGGRPDKPIISPAGLVAQYFVDLYDNVRYRRRDTLEQRRALSTPHYATDSLLVSDLLGRLDAYDEHLSAELRIDEWGDLISTIEESIYSELKKTAKTRGKFASDSGRTTRHYLGCQTGMGTLRRSIREAFQPPKNRKPWKWFSR